MNRVAVKVDHPVYNNLQVTDGSHSQMKANQSTRTGQGVGARQFSVLFLRNFQLLSALWLVMIPLQQALSLRFTLERGRTDVD